MLLEELHWEGPGTVDELDVWGISPILDQLERFDEYIQPCCVESKEDEGLVFFYYDLKHKVERLQKTIYRLFDEMDGSGNSPADQVMDLIREVSVETRKNIKERLERVYLKDVPDHETKDAVTAEAAE